jgi:hypothetical protein
MWAQPADFFHSASRAPLSPIGELQVMVADRQRQLVELTGAINRTILISHSARRRRRSATMAASISLASALVGAEIVSLQPVAAIRLDASAPMSRGECLKSTLSGRSWRLTASSAVAPYATFFPSN